MKANKKAVTGNTNAKNTVVIKNTYKHKKQ